MRFINLLPLAALSTAFVIPDEAVAQSLVLEVQQQSTSFLERLPSKDDIFSQVEDAFTSGIAFGANALDNALTTISAGAKKFECHASMMKFDAEAWLASASDSLPLGRPEHDGDDHDHHKKPHHKRPHHKGPHHGHEKPNLTVYELIAKSKYTTKLAALINEYDDLVELLNGTSANFTVFAPTDKAFEKIPKHHGKPSKEIIKKVLSYHVSSDFYPAGRVLISHTIPTLYEEEKLGGAQRLRLGLGLGGLKVNFYSKVIAVNIFGTNGVIHGVDSLLLPPPPALKIIELLPGEFSTLQLALTKTGLAKGIAEANHVGGTLFAPSNFAFQKLGPKVNAFLFSKYGEKYLAALLKYHVVANETLYSDAFYNGKDADEGTGSRRLPKGVYHVDLPTLLGDKSLSIDVARFGGLINIRINGYTDVAVQDGLARDGVIQIPRSVLIPPKSVGGTLMMYNGGELTVEDLKERLDPLVEEGMQALEEL